MEQNYDLLLEKFQAQNKFNEELRRELNLVTNKLNYEVIRNQQSKLNQNLKIMAIPKIHINDDTEGIINNIGKYLKVNIGKYQSFGLGRGEIGKVMPIKVEFDSEQVRRQ
ncbi:hypothetical protein JTB14_028427 [Gonioctena quinquepunctata]|nr:hypothetical protein JTB14_028427 [Gonioctena quinquepunctata]